MTPDIGRLGSIGFAFQSAFGTANTTPSTYLRFNSDTLEGVHEVLPITSAVAHRMSDTGSVKGKKSGAGAIEVDLDVVDSGYLFKWALGNEQLTAGTPNEHQFYTTVSGNTPRFATLINTRSGADVEEFDNAACDKLTLTVTDGIGTLSADIMSSFPITASTQSPVTVSGTVFSFANYAISFGSTLVAAQAASPTPIQEFNLEIANNIEVIHSSQSISGTASNDVAAIRTKNLTVTGSYKLFFDSVTELNAQYGLDKRAMYVRFSNGALEDLTVKIAKFRLNEKTIDTGVDDLYMITGNFVAEIDRSQVPNDIQVIINNSKSSTY